MLPATLVPDSAGCAGRHDGGRRICVSEPVLTVKHELTGPRPRVIRVFVCEAHAVGQLDPRPLTPTDRAELRRRRADRLATPPGSPPPSRSRRRRA